MPSEVTRRGLLGAAMQVAAASQLPAAGAAQLIFKGADAAPERRSSFDEGWRFTQGDVAGGQAPDFSDRDWSAVDVPHDWSIAGPFLENAPSGGSGGYAPTGIGWYRKTFPLPSTAAGKRVAIQFDGVYQRSEVWVNGHALGMRPNGYVSFVYDLTPHLRFGGEPNTIAVRVDNGLQPNSRWYSGSGIYRHVWLLVTDPIHILPWGTVVRASVLSSGSATVDVSTRVANVAGKTALVTLRASIVDAGGQTVAMADAHGHVQAGAETLFEHRLRIGAPALWSPESPTLYAVRLALTVGDVLRDTETTTFGVRDARFDVNRGFLLNGARIKLNGVCVHADGGAVGAAVPERVWERRLEYLKAMGCNAIRCSHNPPAAEFLDLCDRMGLLVMGEPFDEWREPKIQTPDYGYHHYFDAWWERDVRNMLERDRNHPSIVIWSAGNEVPDQKSKDGPSTLQRLLDVFHAMDPTRPVTVACDNIAAEPDATLDAFLEELDVVGYNYVDRWRDRREKYYSIDRHDHPKRRFIGTESTGLGGVRGENVYAADALVFFERASNSRIAVEQLQKFIHVYDYVSGDFIWTGFDYLGESRWPRRIATAGALDTCSFPKDSYYFYQSLWSTEAVLYLCPHWNWPDKIGKIVAVSCYTNCDTVELFLNDRSLGVKGYAFPRPGHVKAWNVYPPRAQALQTTADLHLSWDVPYEPGVLRAVGTKDEQVVSTFEIRTSGAPAAIRLSVDRERIKTSRNDVAHVTVEIVDSNGVVVPLADNEIAFDLRGNGRILGVDNGRPDSDESYQSNRRKAFHGLALVLLQSAGAPGEMTLSASSPSLTGGNVRVIAET